MFDASIERVEYHILCDDHISLLSRAAAHFDHFVYDNCEKSNRQRRSHGEDSSQQAGVEFQGTQTGGADAWRCGAVILPMPHSISHIHAVDHHCAGRNGEKIRRGKLLQLLVLQSHHVVSEFGHQSDTLQFNVVEVSQGFPETVLQPTVVPCGPVSAFGTRCAARAAHQHHEHDHDDQRRIAEYVQAIEPQSNDFAGRCQARQYRVVARKRDVASGQHIHRFG